MKPSSLLYDGRVNRRGLLGAPTDLAFAAHVFTDLAFATHVFRDGKGVSYSDARGCRELEAGVMSSLPAVPQLEKREALEPGFVDDFITMARSVGVDPDYLAASVSIESGFDPAATNRSGNPPSNATGLIQWMPQYAPVYGTTVDELRRMTGKEQLPFIAKTFKHWGSLAPRDTYLAIFWPAGVGKPDDAVLTSEGEKAYASNRGLDFDHDGRITAGDVRTVADTRLAQAKGRRVESGGSLEPVPMPSPQPEPVPPTPTFEKSGGLGLALLAAIGGVFVLSRK